MTASFFSGIDHITLGVKSLQNAVDTFKRLGFVMTPQGQHNGMGTYNHCIMMPSEYLELAALSAEKADSEFRRNVQGAITDKGDGVMGMAFTTNDGAGVYQALLRNGIKASEPIAIYRDMTSEDGKALQVALSMVRMPAKTLDGFSSSAVQHLTPEALRKPAWMQHPNGVIATTSLTVVVEDPLVAKASYEKLFGAGVAAITDTTVTIHLGRHRVFLCTPDQLTQLHPDFELEDAPIPPLPVAMGLKVKDVNATETVLKSNGVLFHRLKEGMIRVPPSETHGILIEFSEED